MSDKGSLLTRLRHRIRVSRLNSKPGYHIAASTYIATSAMIQTESDGTFFGGRVRLSDGVIISDGVVIATYGGTIEIGDHAYIGPYSVLYGHGGLSIGRNTMIGALTVIVPANHGFAEIDVPMNVQPLAKEGIDIGADVWIGAGCKILDGVRIGNGAVIGAGSVVTRAIEAYGIAVGVPATVVRHRSESSTESVPPAMLPGGERPQTL